MATPSPAPAPVTPEVVLTFVAQLVEAHSSRAVSAQSFALAELLQVARALPPGAKFSPPPAPADEIRRTAGDSTYVLRAIDGVVTETVLDPHGDDTTSAYTPDEVRQKIRDLGAVLQALESRRV